jgi:hypothetical protein
LHIHLQRIDTFSTMLPPRYMLQFPRRKKSVPELNAQPTYMYLRDSLELNKVLEFCWCGIYKLTALKQWYFFNSS